MKIKGYLLAALSAISYGTIPLFALPLRKEEITFDAVLAYRFFFTAVIIGVYLILRKEKFKVTFREMGVLMALGLLFAMSSHFLFWAYDFMSVGIASTLLFMYPVFVALIMALMHFIDHFGAYINFCAKFIPPFFGIIVADYFFIYKKKGVYCS